MGWLWNQECSKSAFLFGCGEGEVVAEAVATAEAPAAPGRTTEFTLNQIKGVEFTLSQTQGVEFTVSQIRGVEFTFSQTQGVEFTFSQTQGVEPTQPTHVRFRDHGGRIQREANLQHSSGTTRFHRSAQPDPGGRDVGDEPLRRE